MVLVFRLARNGALNFDSEVCIMFHSTVAGVGGPIDQKFNRRGQRDYDLMTADNAELSALMYAPSVDHFI
jgi:hypothetical protein